MGNKFLLSFSAGLLLGVAVESFGRFGISLAVLILMLALCSLIIETRGGFTFGNKGRYLMPIFLVSMALGLARMDLAEPKEFPLDQFLGQKINIEGVITEEPDVRERQVFLTVKVQGGSPKGKATVPDIIGLPSGEDTKILAKTESLRSFTYGSRVILSGKLDKPKSFETDSGGEFDYASYLRKSGILYIMDTANVSVVGTGQGSPIKAVLFSLKNKFIESIGHNIGEPESSLLDGLVVGGKRSLGEVWLDRFQRAGVMHVVVLSGYNITIVANSVIAFFNIFLSSVVSMILGAVSIILFAIMTGGSATVIRATIMAMIVILSRYAKRDYVATRALLIAGVVMVLQNPWIVAFDPSFQLSFMATLALIYVSPVVGTRAKFLTGRFGIREVVVSSISTQIFVLPLLLSMTGKFSVVFLPVNLLILSFVPLTMFLGFFAGVLGMITPIIAVPFAYPAYALLAYELKVVEWFASLPFAAVAVPAISGGVVIIVYALFVLILLAMYRKIELPFLTGRSGIILREGSPKVRN